MSPLDKAFEDVQLLVKKFTDNLSHYMSPGYSEAEARQDFIDDFFIALGWDVRHKEQTNPYAQEVKIEKSQKQQNETARKRADYAFFIGPNYKDEVFFAEAKKPSVLIENNPQHYFQTIKYGWNSGCPISVLTDFEEFAIIDCRSKPDIKYALNGKHKTYRYTDYADKEKFAEIYWLFSREAVAQNSLTKYAAALPKPKGKVVQKQLFKGSYQAIDDSFLEYIDGIRENIAKAFKKANENLNSEQLTEATQRTVDRLVFIRFLEDKFIEAEEHVSEWQSWKDFISDCRKLDAKYNGVVFKKHFIDEPNFLGADEKLFLDICSDISNLNSPYDFNYIPIHILGSIYERFLGKIVRATDKRVFIEEKPEVRKAGGVYYTPKYIVDYIVKNTVGKIIEGLSPKQIAEKRFADIACGSGSFLIGVYDYLLDYHKKYYTEKYNDKIPQLLKDYASYEKAKRGPITEDGGNIELRDGQWVLTLKLKQQILLNNIYGVDIDAQAVEVTQLSLFLKMLDEETIASTTAGALFSKVLPDLSKNIVCGNSLITPEFTNQFLFNYEEEKKLNPIDLKVVFKQIFIAGGFDSIIGNPPYSAKQSIDNKKLTQLYDSVEYKCDPFAFFLQRGLNLLKNEGKLGYIVPLSWMTNLYYRKLRKLFIETKSLETVIQLKGLVFSKANVDTSLIFLSKNSTTRSSFVYSNNSLDEIGLYPKERSYSSITEDDDYSITADGDEIWLTLKKKIDVLSISLSKISKISLGMKLRSNDEFIVFEKSIQNPDSIIFGKDIAKYNFLKAGRFFNFEKAVIVGGTKNITIQKGKPKIFIQAIRNLSLKERIIATLDEYGFYFIGTVNAVTLLNTPYDIKYILGLLNSTLHNTYFKKRFTTISLTSAFIGVLPIRELDLKNKVEKQLHDKLVTLVTQMLESKKQLAAAVTDSDKNFLQNKCSSIDRQIDNLVYQLYGLTEEEIKIVENG